MNLLKSFNLLGDFQNKNRVKIKQATPNVCFRGFRAQTIF